MIKKLFITALAICLLLASWYGHAQKKQKQQSTKSSLLYEDKSELERRRQALLDEIKQTQQELNSLQKDKQASVRQLEALQAKLSARQALIENINKEINIIERNIQAASGEVNNLSKNLGELKRQYAEIIRYTYKKKSSYDMLVFLFSSQGFNDAVKRMQYVKQYREYRKKQAETIIFASNQYKSKIQNLSQQRQEKDNILLVQQQQQQELASESAQKAKVVQEFKGREKELMVSINKKQKDAQALNAAIAAVIKREIEIARKKAEEERKKQLAAKAEADRRERERLKEELALKKKAAAEEARIKAEQEKAKSLKAIASGTPKANTKAKPTETAKASAIKATKPALPAIENDNEIALNTEAAKPKAEPVKAFNYNEDMSAENKAMSLDFESNRGRLPSPVSGYICEKYGKNKHPVFNVITENFGVDIRTSKGNVAKAVFGGEVISIAQIPGTGYTVIVNHGKYYTVYSKLQSVSVSKGTKLGIRQNVGTVLTNEDGNTQLHFEIWQVSPSGKSSTVNPQNWIML